MEFKEKLVSSHLAFDDGMDLSDLVHQTRVAALKVFEEKGFPTKKDEAWKYTSLANLINQDYAIFPKDETNVDLKKSKNIFYSIRILTKLFLLMGSTALFYQTPPMMGLMSVYFQRH